MNSSIQCSCLVAGMCLALFNLPAADQYFAGDGSAFTAAKWGNSAGGPFAANFTNGNIAYFSTVNGTGSGSVGITVAGIVATENHTHSSPSGTLLNQGNAVVPVTVAAGKVFDLSTAAITSSGTAGYIKNGAGALVWAGGTFGGGFTLNDGFLIARGVNAMGVGPLVINGGAIGGTATRDFSGKFTSVTVGGDFQIGVLSSSVAVALSTANLTFDADFNLGSALRTITIGGNGTYTMANVFTGTGSAGVVFTNAPSATGTIALQKSNTYPGLTVLGGGNVTVNAVATFGNGTGVLRFAGGVLGIAGTRSTSSDFINNPIELTASSTIRSTGGTDNTSRIVVFSSGSVTTLDGTLTLQNGAASATNNVFEVRLLGGGFDVTRPIVLDNGAGAGNFARLYLGGSNTAAPQIISGVISGNGLVRRSAVTASTAGTSILTAANTYSGGTDVLAGTLLVNNTSGSGTGSGAVTVSSTGVLGGTGSIGGPVTVSGTGTLAPGSDGIGTLTVANTVSLGGVTRMELNRTNSQTADKLVRVGGALAFGGTLTLTNVGPAPVNGDVFDLFDADSFSGSFATLNLPPGGAVHWVTSQLAVNGTVLFTNNHPVAKNLTLGVPHGASGTLTVIGGKNAPTDADGDALTITGVGTPTSGSASFTATTLTYTASGTAGTNTFTYTVSDGFGGTDTKTVTVVVSPVSSGANIVPGTLVVSGNNVKLDALGIPGATYRLEFTEDLTPPITWTPLTGSEETAAANGAMSFDYTHGSPLPPLGFFRTQHVP